MNFSTYYHVIREWHNFDPLCKIIGCYQQEPKLRLCLRKWANYVQPPLHERLGAP